MTTAVLYARFSCDRQREQSIEDQLREDHDYCEARGWKVVNEYADYARTGTNANRPAFQLMISNAGEADHCVVWSRDRFARNVEDAMRYERLLLDHGCTLESVKESLPDESDPTRVLMQSLYAGLAAMESAKTSVRTKRGMRGNALKCEYLGYRCYGYSVGPDNRYVINDTEADLVREAFRRRLEMESVNAIARDFAARGVTTNRGNPCSANMVTEMLRNERYTGVYIWSDIRIEGGMPEIIDRSTFEAVQGVIGRKSRMKEKWDEYPLSGKAICGACGATMVGISGRGKANVKYLYYRCGKRCQGVRNVRKDYLERVIVDGVRELLSDREEALRIARVTLETYKEPGAVKREAAQDRLRQAQEGQKNILAAIESGIIPRGARERLMELELAEDKAKRELLTMDTEEHATPEDLADFLQFGATLTDDKLLRLFVHQAVVTDDVVLVVLNVDDKKGEPVRLSLDRCLYSSGMAAPTVVVLEHHPVIILPRSA